ncbi:hypothetical protein MMC18_006166 [Xylographa bjoerkii]|nr:hypothetical protein [Xylographa bjoerkii]
MNLGTTQTMNIWQQMSYVPPRGPCGYKSSLMTPACGCLRFMIHPVKAATSFECDGCSHHASYHQMENKAENEIISGWKVADRALEQEKYHEDEADQNRPKRKRLEITQGTVLNSNMGTPENTRSTLVGPGRKRTKSQKTL